MIDVIINLINNSLDGLHDSEIVLGLVQSVYRVNNSGTIEFMPGVVKADGEALYAGIDDVNSIMLYHKTNNAALSFGNRSGFGDSRQSEDSISCSLIAVWDMRKIKIHSADMVLLLRSRMPQQVLDVPGINQVNIIPTAALLNTKQIFESEYAIDSSYLLPIYMSFIQINYTVQIKYDQNCIEKCINCSK